MCPGRRRHSLRRPVQTHQPQAHRRHRHLGQHCYEHPYRDHKLLAARSIYLGGVLWVSGGHEDRSGFLLAETCVIIFNGVEQQIHPHPRSRQSGNGRFIGPLRAFCFRHLVPATIRLVFRNIRQRLEFPLDRNNRGENHEIRLGICDRSHACHSRSG
jgi:hypothetical protein